MRVSEKEFILGCLQRNRSGDLTLTRENGAYIIRGFKGSKHVVEGVRTLTQARKLLAKLDSET